MIDQSSRSPDQASSLSWQLDTEVVTLPTLCPPQPTSCWGRANRAPASGSRSGDLGNVARTRGQTSPSAITARARWTGLKIPWRFHFIGPAWCWEIKGGHHWDENVHESSGSGQSGPRVIGKYFNTTSGTKTFLPKKVNKHKSFSVLWSKETQYKKEYLKYDVTKECRRATVKNTKYP